MQVLMRFHLPHIVTIEQPLELLRAQRDRLRIEVARPGKLLPAFNHFVPDNEMVFIKPLFRMSLIDRENAVGSLLSWGVSAWSVPA